MKEGENIKSWKTDQELEAKIKAEAESNSIGNGHSMVGAGPQGTQAGAKGTEGTSVGTNYANENKSWENSWGYHADGTGN